MLHKCNLFFFFLYSVFPFYNKISGFQKFQSHPVPLQIWEKNWSLSSFFPESFMTHVATQPLLKIRVFTRNLLDLKHPHCPTTGDVGSSIFGLYPSSCKFGCFKDGLVIIQKISINFKTSLFGIRYYLCLINRETKLQLLFWFLGLVYFSER